MTAWSMFEKGFFAVKKKKYLQNKEETEFHLIRVLIAGIWRQGHDLDEIQSF